MDALLKSMPCPLAKSPRGVERFESLSPRFDSLPSSSSQSELGRNATQISSRDQEIRIQRCKNSPSQIVLKVPWEPRQDHHLKIESVSFYYYCTISFNSAVTRHGALQNAEMSRLSR